MSSKSVVVTVAGDDKSGEMFKAIGQHCADLQAKAAETSAALGGIGKFLEKGLAFAGIAIGAREIIGGFKEMVKSTMESGVQLAHLNQQTGISVANLSVLKYAAQATGVDFDVLTRGFKKLSVTTYEADNGNKTAAKGFAQLGISVSDLRAKGNDMYGVMTMVAEKFHAMPDGIAKSDTAAKIFGARMGSELIPVLDALGGKMDTLKAEAESLGVVWDEAGIKKMEEMHHSAAMLQGSLQALGLELATSLSGPLKEVARLMTIDIELFNQFLSLGKYSDEAKRNRAADIVGAIPQKVIDNPNAGKDAGASKGAIQEQLVP
jgi:DNA-binding Xre family transcriptional regulator